MSFDHVVENASKDIDPLFNLMSVKYKLLMNDQQCDYCGLPSSEWSIIRVCHNIVCKECMDKINNLKKSDEIITCQKCDVVFDPVKDITTNHDMKIAYFEMEDLLWKVIALEHGVLDEDLEQFVNESDIEHGVLDEDLEQFVNESDIEHGVLDEDLEQFVNESDIEHGVLDEDLEQFVNESDIESENVDFIDGIKPIKSSPKTDFEEKIKLIKNVKIAEQVKDLVTAKLNNSQVITDFIESSQHKKLKMSDDQSTDSSTSSSESEEDVIEGTPDRCHVSDPASSFKQKHKNIVITYTNLETDDELDVLRELVHLFDLHAHTSWSERVTHLVVKTLNDGTCLRTRKYVNALLSNCFIVTFEWAKDCLKTKTLRPELDYMPVDMCGEPSPMVSWRVGRGIIESPMEWTSKCILYFHSSVEFNESYSDVVGWAKKAGFVLTNEMGEFKGGEFKMRIILADVSSSEDPRSRLPNETEISRWMCDYKAVTLFVDWFLECLFRYRFVEINPRFQVIKLDPNVAEFTDMNESLFEFEY